VSTPKTGARRPYRQRARADAALLTRRRIAGAAVELHTSIGPLRTTISAIADRAGVERVTVYRHFPDDRALFAACSNRFLEDHPPPDLTGPMSIADPLMRIEAVLLAVYAYYRQQEPMISTLLRDVPAVPLLAEYLGPYLVLVRDVADALAAGLPGAPNPHLVRAAIGHALAFPTWQSLARDQGLPDHECVGMTTSLVNGLAQGRRSDEP
jgi:AcrR family transcriptional regulator